jgi:uncharacterized protein with GYD domain
VESIYFTASGEYHIAMTAEYPDAATAAAVIALLVSTGAVSKFNTKKQRERAAYLWTFWFQLVRAYVPNQPAAR